MNRKCMLRRHLLSLPALAVAAALGMTAAAQAAGDTVKIGLLLPMSGTFTEYGRQMENGIRLFLKQHGDTVAGKKIELVIKDDGGIAPEKAKKAAQELLVRDKVDVLAGFAFTASALAVAPLAKSSGTPMVVTNASSSGITAAHPYMVRVGQTLPQITEPAGRFAAESGRKRVYVLVADVTAGHDAEKAFVRGLTAGGGEVIGSVRVPAQNPDFAPFIQRIKDAKPDAVFTWLPPGEATIGFIKGFNQRGLAAEGVEMLGTGDLTDDLTIEATGDPAIGVITTGHYSMAHKSALNETFVKEYLESYPNDKRPNFLSVSAYDGIAAIYKALEATGGDTDGEKFTAALAGIRFESPRGPLEIDTATRDIVQTIYVRKVEKVDDKLFNVEFHEFPQSRDTAQ
ncbi:MAG: ABC transporter substrate-binding protein [Pseudochelatococcus sp.]|jgi:branched-chain amino acid transport system substrate-binding protein|uniref:ABC transporter substrate-binding protein n=1 Tax=Pseudochelatococcus sp. TaxID=2020869 RepID=UPI003D8FF774